MYIFIIIIRVCIIVHHASKFSLTTKDKQAILISVDAFGGMLHTGLLQLSPPPAMPPDQANAGKVYSTVDMPCLPMKLFKSKPCSPTGSTINARLHTPTHACIYAYIQEHLTVLYTVMLRDAFKLFR